MASKVPFMVVRASRIVSTRGLVPSNLLHSRKFSMPPIAAQFPGVTTTFTTDLRFVKEMEKFPAYRVMDDDGNVLDESQDPQLGEEMMVKMYSCMVKLNVMDNILYDAQRQGRLSFYMTSFGEEGTHLGAAAALDDKDLFYGQYREAGILAWRGFSYQDFTDQCTSNGNDPAKGRQMPMHFGCHKRRIVTISSPIATQIPQAAGSAYAYKVLGVKQAVVCFFGDGATSEGDFHAGMNFASTTEAPVIFFCRNNGYAISTSAREQYRGDGLAPRGVSYGMPTIRVDGNDMLAVYNATKEARRLAMQNQPVFVEALSYRVGHHSTSDDSTRYRKTAEIEKWRQQKNPINRVRQYLERRGWWSSAREDALRGALRKELLAALVQSEKTKLSPIDTMFEDVYDRPPPNLVEQRAALHAHLEEFGQHYGLDKFEAKP